MSALRIHNTLTRSKEAFVPRTPGQVGLYVCGPTVYDYFHIGNARTFTVFDMVVRWLRASGFEVTYVRNITDIDDKIMDRARENGEPIEALTERMVAAFTEDTARLNLLKPDIEPRATHYIGPMLDMISALETKGHAYRGANGDVFYAVRSFADYGKLSRRNLDDLRAGERVAVEAAKRDPLDFVLWKAAKPGEPRWPSPFGDGRPGWHIECSAMSCRELGFPFDIHGGGWDLQFPHHENEIAQSEGATGSRFVDFWMHAAFLNIDHEKMSKSLGNFFTMRDVLDKLDPVQGGEQVRFFLLRGHYRSELAYSKENLDDALNTLKSLYGALVEVPPEDVQIDWSDRHALRFRDAMNDDFDTPTAFSVFHELKTEINRSRSNKLAGLLKALGGTIGLLQMPPREFMKIVNVYVHVPTGGIKLAGHAPAVLVTPDQRAADLQTQRDAARKARDFPLADSLRKKISGLGYDVLDRPDGSSELRKR